MNGSTSELVESAGLDKELIDRFKQAQELGAEEKKTVLSLLDAFIAKSRIQDLLDTP